MSNSAEIFGAGIGKWMSVTSVMAAMAAMAAMAVMAVMAVEPWP